jgi:hypothetical protein
MSTFVARKFTLISLFGVTPLGFFFKLYSGPGRWWFNQYGAGLLYEMFWILIAFFFFPTKKAVNRIPVWVFTITGILEVFQLWHPSILERIRSNFWGSALIGTTFVWWDFPHYAIGCAAGWLLIRQIAERSAASRPWRKAIH